MDGDQDLVTLTVDPDCVIVVLVLVQCGSELDVDLLSDSGWDHAFLVVPNFEVVGLWRQNVQSLRRWGVVDQSQFHSVRFICLKTSEFDHGGGSSEDAIGAYGVIFKFACDGNSFVGLGLGHYAPLNFDDVVSAVWRGGQRASLEGGVDVLLIRHGVVDGCQVVVNHTGTLVVLGTHDSGREPFLLNLRVSYIFIHQVGRHLDSKRKIISTITLTL